MIVPTSTMFKDIRAKCQCSVKHILAMFSICVFGTIVVQRIIFTNGEKDLFYENFKKELQLQKQDTITDLKPFVVLGILSSDENRERRNVIRKTWLKTIKEMKNELPFRITYKFFLDKNGTETYDETRFYNDIVYLNVPEHGYAIKFGRKMYVLLSYMYQHYREAELIIRIDDDAFLCVPQVFQRLENLMSPNLYYGWRHGDKDVIGPAMIDEMFLAIGKNIVKWVATQPFCGLSNCAKNTLQDSIHGSTSLRDWLISYKDLDFHSDNKRIAQIHIPANSTDWMKYATFDYCKDNIVFHKVKISSFMKKMHTNNEKLKKKISNIGSVSGEPFSGKIVTSLPNDIILDELSIAQGFKMSNSCLFWAVVTTIFEPSNAINFIASLREWCLVIVADVKTPKEEYFLAQLGQKSSDKIVYLSIERQMHLYPLLTDSLPFSSFARKNIGYIYAIHHKAKLIWDFDDDNVGVISKHGYNYTKNFLTPCKHSTNYPLINPYPYFIQTDLRLWPRGFPLNELKNPLVNPKLCSYNSLNHLGVIQSLANGEADVDAIYRLTYNPFNFSAKADTDKMLVLPQYSFTPFNAQATLWFPKAFKYMALPISVHGRVTDIWRSYIAEYFFYKSNITVAFSPPYVFHNRTKHNIMGDFHAETPLYEQSGKLVELLSTNNYDSLTSLYNDMFQRSYLQKEDLHFIRVWEKTFNYVF